MANNPGNDTDIIGPVLDIRNGQATERAYGTALDAESVTNGGSAFLQFKLV
jgi:hypothetical protein